MHKQVENVRKNTLNLARKHSFQGLSMPQSVRAGKKIRVQLFQSEFGNMKIAGWTGPRRVFLQNNYLIIFSPFF